MLSMTIILPLFWFLIFQTVFNVLKFEQAFPPLYQLLVVYLKGAYWVLCFSFCLLMIFLINLIIQTGFFSLMTQNSFVRQIAVI